MTAARHVTNTALLEGLKRADRTVWVEFVGRFRPVILGYARRMGLAEPDAEDTAQEVLAAFDEQYRGGRYDRGKGRLRSWLFGIASNTIRAQLRRHQRVVRREPPGTPTDVLRNLPEPDTQAEVWEEEWREALVRQCLEQVRQQVHSRTFAAFERFVVQEWPARRVAEELAISENAVLCAKQRVLRRLRALVEAAETDG